MNENYIARFSFEITEEQQARANNLLNAYGLRRAIFSRILDDVLDIVETHGGMAIGVMLSGHIKPRDMISTLKDVEKLAKLQGGEQDG